MRRPSHPLVFIVQLGLVLAMYGVAAAWITDAELIDGINEEWRWVHFGVEAGLPSPKIRDVVTTDEGTMWVATSGGLAWFDDYQWQSIRLVDLPTRAPRWMAPIGADSLAVVTEDGQVYVGDRQGLDSVSLQALGDTSMCLAVVRFEDRLAVLTPTGLYDLSTAARIGAELPWRPTTTWGMSAGRLPLSVGEHTLWLGTAAGLARFDASGWSLVMPGVAVAHLDRTEGLLAAAIIQPVERRGLWELRPGQAPVRVKEEIGVIHILALAPDGQGLALCEALHLHVRQEGRWQQVGQTPAWMGPAKRVIFDQGSDLWIATEDGLWLARLSDRLWSRHTHAATHDQESSISRGDHAWDRICTLHKDNEGNLWVGSDGGLEVLRADGTVGVVTHAAGVDLSVITGVQSDPDGRLWISSGSAFGGALVLENGLWTRTGAEEGLTDAPIHRILTDGDRRIWFLTLGDGAWVRERDGQIRRWSLPAVQDAERVYDLVQAEDGTIWMATLAGLLQWRDGTWRRWTITEGLAHRRVFTVAVDATDRLWFGHGEGAPGVGCIDSTGTVRYDVEGAEVIRGNVYEIRWSSESGLWLTAGDGLWGLGPHGWTGTGIADGLPSRFLWPVLPAGRRVFVGTRGRGMASANLNALGPAPRIQLQPTHADEHLAAGGNGRNDSIHVDGRQASLKWIVYPYHGLHPGPHVQTRYRLDDEAWSAWSYERAAVFGQLTYGEHAVEIQAKGRLGLERSTLRSTFTLAQPFHKRPAIIAVALCLSFLGLLGLAAGLLRRRRFLRQLRLSEDRFRMLLEGVSDGILICDLDGQIIHANATAAAFSGRSVQEIQGLNVGNLLAAGDVTELRRLWRLLVPAAPVVRRDLVLDLHGGQRPVEMRATKVFDRGSKLIHLGLRDNAAELEAERQARVRLGLQRLRNQVVQMESEADWEPLLGTLEKELHRLVSFHNCCVNIIEDDSRVVQYVEWGHEVDRRVLDHVPEPIRTCWQDQRPVYRRTRQDMKSESFDLNVVRVRSVIDIPFSAGTLGLSHPDDDGFDAAAVDILEQFAQVLSEAHRRVQDLHALATQGAMIQRSRRHERLLHLATGVAHEINNPLTQVVGFAELLQRNGHREDTKEILASICDAGRTAAAITQRLLQLARREEQGVQWIDINDIVAENVALVSYSFAARQVKVELQPAPITMAVMVAPGDVSHILLTLLQICRDRLARHGGGPIMASAEGRGRDSVIRIGNLPSAGTRLAAEPVLPSEEDGLDDADLNEIRAIATSIGGRLSVEHGAGTSTYALYLPTQAAGTASRQRATAPGVAVQQGETV